MSKKEEGVKSATGPEMNKFLNGHFENKAPIFQENTRFHK